MNIKIDRRTFFGFLPIFAPTVASGASHVFPEQSGDQAGAASQGAVEERNRTATRYTTAQQAIDAATREAGDRVIFGPGKTGPVTINRRNVWLEGRGIDISVVLAAENGGSAITLSDKSGAWNPICIEDLTIQGSSRLNAVGIRYGQGRYAAGDEYIGRLILDKVKFVDLDKAIDRPYGNIGLWIDRCVFNAAHHHLFSTAHKKADGGDEMHPGNMIVSNSYFSGATRSSVYIDGGVSGAGQVTFQNCIFELNPGTVFDIRNFPVAVGPGVSILSCWNELNHTGATRAGRSWFANFERVESIYFHDTPVGPMRLRRSNVTTNQCDLTSLEALDSDADSTLTHHNARAFSGTPQGLVESIGSISSNADQINCASFAMTRPIHVGTDPEKTLYSFDGQSPLTLGAAQTVTSAPLTADPALPHPYSTTQSLAIDKGQTLVTVERFSVPANAWLVFQYLARIEEGGGVHVQLNGPKAIGGTIQITGRQWRCYTSILKHNGPAAGEMSIYHFGQGRRTNWRIAGISLVALNSAQEALAHANSKTMLLNRRFALAVEETLLIPMGGSTFRLQGSGSIRSMVASAADAGRTVTLIIAKGTILGRTGNIILANAVDGGAAMTLTLVCDGRQWIETARVFVVGL